MKSNKRVGVRVAVVSPPVWGAWVEIPIRLWVAHSEPVAPRVGGVG